MFIFRNAFLPVTVRIVDAMRMTCQVLNDPVMCSSRKRSVLVSTFSSTYFMSSISSVSSSVSACVGSQIYYLHCSCQSLYEHTCVPFPWHDTMIPKNRGSTNLAYLSDSASVFSLRRPPTSTACCPDSTALSIRPPPLRPVEDRPLGHTHPTTTTKSQTHMTSALGGGKGSLKSRRVEQDQLMYVTRG